MAAQLDKIEEGILAKLGELAQRYDALESQMSDPEVVNNHSQMSKLAREHGTLKGMVQEYRRYQTLKISPLAKWEREEVWELWVSRWVVRTKVCCVLSATARSS